MLCVALSLFEDFSCSCSACSAAPKVMHRVATGGVGSAEALSQVCFPERRVGTLLYRCWFPVVQPSAPAVRLGIQGIGIGCTHQRVIK